MLDGEGYRLCREHSALAHDTIVAYLTFNHDSADLTVGDLMA